MEYIEYIICAVIGYGLGTFNPTYLISRMKNKDIRKSGTGNLGTTNAFINFGKGWGSFVLICDMIKAIVAVKVCVWLFPGLALAGVLAGCMAVIGHIYPFYVGFKGGKGVACFGGLILAVDIKYFFILLAVGCCMALIFNYGCSISFSAAVLFPILYAGRVHSVAAFFLLMVCSGIIMYKHIDNIKKIKAGKEIPIREFLKKHIFEKAHF